MFLIHTRVGKCSSPFSSGCFMICFYINSLIYLEFVSVFEVNRDLALLFSERLSTSSLSSICSVVHLGPLIQVLF